VIDSIVILPHRHRTHRIPNNQTMCSRMLIWCKPHNRK